GIWSFLVAQPDGACCLKRARFDLDISIQTAYSATPAAPRAYAVVVLCALSQALKRGHCMANSVLQLEDLTVRFHLKRGQLTAIDGVTFTVHRGETFGLVGESGSGKTATARSVMRLIPIPPGEVVGGRILFEGTNILACSDQQMRELRGKKIAMVFQEPM